MDMLQSVVQEDAAIAHSEQDGGGDGGDHGGVGADVNPVAVNRSSLMVVLNKADLGAAAGVVSRSGSDRDNGALHNYNGSITSNGAGISRHSVSCLSGEGIAELENAVAERVRVLLEAGDESAVGESPLITRERHRRHVSQCTDHLRRFLSGSLPMDAAAEELRL